MLDLPYLIVSQLNFLAYFLVALLLADAKDYLFAVATKLVSFSFAYVALLSADAKENSV